MGVWRENSAVGKATILKKIIQSPGCSIYSVFAGRTNYRLYHNVKELKADGYISVKEERWYPSEKAVYIIQNGFDSDNKIS